jgi:[protein-PII] uridylyltransferase
MALVQRLWAAETVREPALNAGIVLAATGGYGRGQLFPYSDVDLLFCVEKSAAKQAQQPIRRLSQALWDCGIQVAMTTRQPNECDRFDAANPEFGLSLLDLRSLCGDSEVFARLRDKSVAKMRQRDAKTIAAELVRLTRERHAKYGGTLFHLEPNIKDCPGGLRDAHVCQWLNGLRRGPSAPSTGVPGCFGVLRGGALLSALSP